MRYTTTDGPKKPLNAIQEGSLGGKMGIAVNFASVARDLTFTFARRIDDRRDLEDGMQAFLQADGPCFLEVICDQDEMLYPRIPAGQGYAQMVLGPYMEAKA